MDLRLLEYFLAVIDHGGMTRAARALYVAQPSISQAIRTLEQQAGIRLFDRSGRQLVLTPAGESLALTARRLRRDAEQARAAVEAVKELAAGRLELATTATLEVDPLPELAARLCRTYPGVLLSISSPGGSEGVVGEVRTGRAELGLTELPVRASTLDVVELETQEIALVCTPALATRLPDPVPLSAVAAVPVVTMSTVSPAIPRTDAFTAVECSHRPAVWELVRRGVGAAFLPRRLAERQIGGVVVRSLTPRIDQSVGIVHRRGRLSPAARAFLDLAGAGHGDERSAGQ